jgi:benzoyl-CoA reductase/2-hydroxyglutaryl-CoA dehydratase subunit BcrC/BadD/HgdB
LFQCHSTQRKAGAGEYLKMTDDGENTLLTPLLAKLEEEMPAADGTNRKVIGYFCPYFPEEIALAAGMLPVRLKTGDGPRPTLDCVCLMCQCKGIEEPAEKFDVPVFKLKLPPADRYRNDNDCLHVFEKELRALRKSLAGISGRFLTYFDDMRALILCNHIRESLRRLYEYPASTPSPLEWLQVFKITSAGAVMDRRVFLGELRKIERYLNLRQASGVAIDSRIRLMVTGNSLKGIEKLCRIINEAGGNIVADYACQAGMLLRKRVPVFGIAERPIETMSERCLYNAPCECRGDDRARLDRMVRIARSYRVHGLLYYNSENLDVAEDYKLVDSAFYRELSVPAFLITGNDLENAELSVRIKEYIDIIGGRV